MAERDASLQFWDREVGDPTHSSWLSELSVRLYVNRLIDPEQPRWPLDWFEASLGGRRFRRALSIGCGTGALERDLVLRNLCGHVDAFDGSVASLALARSEARQHGMEGRIRYFASDFNRAVLPAGTYDLVLFHQSLHHVERLEHLFRGVMGALSPDGLLYLDEYVGPSRDAWGRATLRDAEAVYKTIPRAARRHDSVPPPVQADDPSEAVRSGEILPLLRVGFRTLAQRGYGGNLLSVLFPIVQWSAAGPTLLEELISAEERLLAGGAENSYYTILVARPRRGLAAAAAALGYRVLESMARFRRLLYRARSSIGVTSIGVRS